MSSRDDARVCLVVLDGAGYDERHGGNAVRPETMPALFASMETHGFAVLGAAAEAVGLEAGQVGNSEAGHLTIGAGRIVPCLTRRILEAYDSGEWAQNAGWSAIAQHGALHVVGLLSDAGVHGLARTLVQAVHTARRAGVREIHVHPVLDGVDSLAGTAPALLDELRQALADLPDVSLGIVAGRKHFCDRSGDLKATEPYADALLGADALPEFSAATLERHLATGVSESQFPAHRSAGARALRPGEPVLITSHRADRARQVVRVLSRTQPIWMMVSPGEGIAVEHVFFPQPALDRGFAHELRRAGLASVRIAEKCKFPHVTFFFNGFDAGVEGDGVCIPSIPEAEIPAAPEMSASEVSERIVASLENPDCRVVVANLANLDQVGHLGRLDIAERAASVVDEAFARLRETAARHGWTLCVTADHGNADRVEDAEGAPFGSHTACPVPFVVIPPPGQRFAWSEREGTLANVAPTCLLGLGIDPPDWMEAPLGHFVAAP